MTDTVEQGLVDLYSRRLDSERLVRHTHGSLMKEDTMKSGSVSVAAASLAVVSILLTLFAVTSASAAEPCGSELNGAGSSLQGVAQTEVWSSGWKGGECEKKPEVKYFSTSSGKGLEQWGANKGVLGGSAGPEKPFPMFVATDIAPEGPTTIKATQLYNMDSAGARNGETEASNEVVAIPVAQSAIAVVVSLPEGCKAEKAEETVLVKSKALEEEWEKGPVAFKSLIQTNLLGKSCEEVKKEEKTGFLPRLEASSSASGETAGFKRYLAQVGPEKNEYKTLTKTAEESAKTEWSKGLSSGLPVEKENTTGKALAQNVLKTAGSTGYVDLADAMAAGFKSKPEEVVKGHESFFVKIQNNKKESAEPTYASPENKHASNCSGVEYKEIPSEVDFSVDWSKVIDKNVEAGGETNYPICTLTFDLAWLDYGAPEVSETQLYSEENWIGLFEYLRYIVTPEKEGGGQSTKLEEEHYAKLPIKVATETQGAMDPPHTGTHKFYIEGAAPGAGVRLTGKASGPIFIFKNGKGIYCRKGLFEKTWETAEFEVPLEIAAGDYWSECKANFNSPIEDATVENTCNLNINGILSQPFDSLHRATVLIGTPNPCEIKVSVPNCEVKIPSSQTWPVVLNTPRGGGGGPKFVIFTFLLDDGVVFNVSGTGCPAALTSNINGKFTAQFFVRAKKAVGANQVEVNWEVK
jgi:hypothetical protein